MSALLLALGMILPVGQTHLGTHIDASSGGGGLGGEATDNIDLDGTYSLICDADGDTTVDALVDDVIEITLGGVARWEISQVTGGIQSTNLGGPYLSQGAASAASPTIRPDRGEPGAGLGYDPSPDEMVIIHNGEWQMRFSGSNASVDKTTIGNNAQAVTSQASDATLLLQQTLNDTTSEGGTQVYAAIHMDVTSTDTSGWDDAYFLLGEDDGSQTFSVELNGTINMPTANGAHLVLPEDADATTPSLCFSADCDIGFYAGQFANTVSYANGGTRIWDFTSTYLSSAITNGPSIRAIATGVSGNIAFNPRGNDANSGYSAVAADDLGIVSGGQLVSRYHETENDLFSNSHGFYSIRETMSFSDFVDGGGLTATRDMNYGIPDGSQFQQAIIHDLTGFTGGSNTTATIQIGTGADPDRYNTGTPSVFTTESSGVDLGGPSGATFHDATTNDITVTITVDNDWSTIDAGQMTVVLFFFGETPTLTDPP